MYAFAHIWYTKTDTSAKTPIPTPCNTLQHPATPCNVLQHHPTPPTHRRRMHCGVEVTESSTNKQHHLSHTCTQYRASLEKRLQQLYTVRNPTKLPDALSVSEEVHLCVCASSLCVCFIFERVFHFWASVSSSHLECLRECQCVRVFQSTRVQTPFRVLRGECVPKYFGWRFWMFTYICTYAYT
jgi:hypothetical protein